MLKGTDDRLRVTLVWALAALLAFGYPVPAIASSAGASSGASEVESVLSVASDPAGAAVYVDGLMQGVTPLNLPVPAGEHRVKVVKDGYLENSRVVSVRRGQMGSVQVRLTPSAGESRLYQVEEAPRKEEKKKGSSLKYIIPIVLVGGGAAAYFALRETNKPPVVSGVTASPTTGLMGATNITFTAQASDPNNDPLTYSWNFGDGGTGSGASATHVYNTAGTFSVGVTVTDPKGKSATGSGSVTIKSLSGSWRGSIAGVSAPTVGTFSQSGSRFSGTMSFTGIPELTGGSISGSVSGQFSVTFGLSFPGFIPVTFNGTADPAVDRLTGAATGSGFTGQSWTLSRQ